MLCLGLQLAMLSVILFLTTNFHWNWSNEKDSEVQSEL